MFTSLRSRLWLTYVLVIFVVLGVSGLMLLFYLLRSPLTDRRMIQRLNDLASIVAVQNDRPWETLSTEQLHLLARRIDRLYGVRVAVIDKDGHILVDSRSATATVLPPLSSLQNKFFINVPLYKDADNKLWLYTLSPLNNNLDLLIATPRSQAPILRELRYEVLPPLIQVGCITSLLTLFLAYWIARWVASPLQRISKAAKAVASGEYQTIPLEGPSEVQTLSRAFNEMSERVKTSQQSQRDLVANVSHELKTPLTSIQGFAQAILDGTANTKDELHQAASVIYTEASRMYRLVLDLLDLARMDSGIAEFKREGVNLERLLQGVAEKFTPQARQAQVNLQVDIGPLASFIGDEDRLNQVFTNLVDNALKITPENGYVILRARQVDGMAEVSVSDTGPGIPPQELSRIFERFYQIDKSRRGGSGHGIGLGLAIVRELIRAHHGSISVYNNSGQGSTFTVKLPSALSNDSTLNKKKIKSSI